MLLANHIYEFLLRNLYILRIKYIAINEQIKQQLRKLTPKQVDKTGIETERLTSIDKTKMY